MSFKQLLYYEELKIFTNEQDRNLKIEDVLKIFLRKMIYTCVLVSITIKISGNFLAKKRFKIIYRMFDFRL